MFRCFNEVQLVVCVCVGGWMDGWVADLLRCAIATDKQRLTNGTHTK